MAFPVPPPGAWGVESRDRGGAFLPVSLSWNPERSPAVVAFPALSALISLACAVVIARDAIRRPRPDKLAWVVAFAVFTIAAGAEVVGALGEWTPALVRIYYLTGAVLVVGYLALGELYLLAAKRIAAFAPGATLLLTAMSAVVVFNAAVDQTRLPTDGWEAIDREPALVALAATINGLGTIIIVGGALYSAWRFRRLGIQRQRMIGCLLIAAGTLVVATGGTLTRFGHREYLYIAMAAGAAVIFAGYLETRRPDAPRLAETAPGAELVAPHDGRGALVSLPAIRANHRPAAPAGDPAVSFVETHFLPLADAALAEACRTWSVERPVADAFTREEARRVWALRLRLPPAAQAVFDAHSVPAQLQLAELYHDVLAPGGTVAAGNG